MAKRFATAVFYSVTLVVACILLAPVSWGRQPGPNDFSGYLVEGYRQLAAEAERSADDGVLSSYFTQRWGSVARGRTLAPEDPTGHALDSWTLREAAFARRQLVERLDGGARRRQPLLAAIAQVNFDCWVAPSPRRIIQPDRDECRRRFYFAFAGLMPADLAASNAPSQTPRPAASTAPAPVVPRITRLATAIPQQPAEATSEDCGESCLVAAFTGPAADALISKLRQNGSDHEAGSDAGGNSNGPVGASGSSRAGATASTGAGSTTGATASTGASGSGGSTSGNTNANNSNDSSNSSSGSGSSSSSGSGSSSSSGSGNSSGSSSDSGSASSSSNSQGDSSSGQTDSGPGHGRGNGHGKGHGKGPG